MHEVIIMARNIGLNVPEPSEECDDVNCPFHGTLPVRGQVLSGKVVSDSMDRTVVIQRKYDKFINKYQRYEKRQSKIHAHNPPCIDAKEGDIVTIAECRPLSKTKSYVVVKAEAQV
jgi:small subunit ribosomal protein S17